MKPVVSQFVGAASRRFGSVAAGAIGATLALTPEVQNALAVVVAATGAYVADLVLSVGAKRGWF